MGSIVNEKARAAARSQWNSIAKPIGGLGELELMVEKIAALTGSADVRIDKRCVAVMCADNGVVRQGVSQCGQEVTAQVARNICDGASSVCAMAGALRADVLAVDMGMAQPVDDKRIIDEHVMRGTNDISSGPAMSRARAERAIENGRSLARDLKNRGYNIVVAGEMGIGNTTTSSALACCLLGIAPEEVVGRGAGLSDAGLANKVEAVRRAIEVNDPDRCDPVDMVSKVGGLDIAGLMGLHLGCYESRLPIVIDGYISAVAAVLAKMADPYCVEAMLPSHISSEPAAKRLFDILGLKPVIDAGMHLGEGTGGVCLLPLLDAALALYRGTKFEETGITPYEVFA